MMYIQIQSLDYYLSKVTPVGMVTLDGWLLCFATAKNTASHFKILPMAYFGFILHILAILVSLIIKSPVAYTL